MAWTIFAYSLGAHTAARRYGFKKTRDRDAVPYLRIKKADAGFRILANCTMRSGSPRRTEAWVAFAVPHGVQRVGVVHIAMRNDGNLLLIVD